MKINLDNTDAKLTSRIIISDVNPAAVIKRLDTLAVIGAVKDGIDTVSEEDAENPNSVPTFTIDGPVAYGEDKAIITVKLTTDELGAGSTAVVDTSKIVKALSRWSGLDAHRFGFTFSMA